MNADLEVNSRLLVLNRQDSWRLDLVPGVGRAIFEVSNRGFAKEPSVAIATFSE